MNLLTSLALLGFVSRNIAMPIVLMQLPEGTDPKKLNGTMFMLPGEGEEFVGPPGGTNKSLTVVVLPTEALNGLDLALPGLSGRRNFLFGQEVSRNGQRNGWSKNFRKADKEENSTSSLDERSNTFDPKDTPFVDDWNSSGKDSSGSEINSNNDESDDSGMDMNSQPPTYGVASSRPSHRGSVKGQTDQVIYEVKDRRKGEERGDRKKKPKKKQPSKPIVEETTDDMEPEEETANEGSRQTSYGSRRTVWGYPTRAQIPYPSYVSKPYPKETPDPQENFYPLNSCSGCPTIQYPVTSQAIYPTSNDQQETFITLPENEGYSNFDSSSSRFVELVPTAGNIYESQSGYPANYGSNVVPPDYPRYEFPGTMLNTGMSSSSGGSLLELPFRSGIPSLLDTMTTMNPQPQSSPGRNFYPVASLIDGRGQVSGYYIQTRRPDNLRPSSSVQNILERLLNDKSNRYTSSSDLDSVIDVSSGEGSTFIPLT